MCPDCFFQDNQITIPSNASHVQVSEIRVMVPQNVKLKSFELTVERTIFDSHSSGSFHPSKMVSITFSDTTLDTFTANIESNKFTNNSLTENGELVSIDLVGITLQIPATINYRLNNVTGNEGVGLMVTMDSVNMPGNISIEDNLFQKNYGEAVSIHCKGICSTYSLNITFANNEISHNSVSLTDYGIMVIHTATLYLINDNFHGNTGTALYILDTNLHVAGKVKFIRNAGKYGGGLGMYGTSDLFANGAVATFTGNLALYGGGIYIAMEEQGPDICKSFIDDNCEFVFHIMDNKASSSGDNVYFVSKDLAECIQLYLEECSNISQYNDLGFGSSVVTIQGVYGNIDNNSRLQIFPGQNIIINSTVFDIFNVQSTCIATVFSAML